MRKLSTIRTISALTPIDGADKIETAHIDGWTVVVGKGEFQEGQKVLFFEIDSMLPIENPLFSFLEPRGVKIVDRVKYHRLKTLKLRGQISQGLILPIPEIIENPEVDVDYSELLGVVKYEPYIHPDSNCKAWPEWISHTDEERIQNLDIFAQDAIFAEREYFISTEKIDGTSCTIWAKIDENGEVEHGVCSRNYGLEYDENNLYWKIANTECLNWGVEGVVCKPIDYVTAKCIGMHDEDKQAHTFVLQGEIFGENIQNNPLGVKGQHIRFFNCIVDGEYLTLPEVDKKYPELRRQWVPVHNFELPENYDEIISQPDGVYSLVPEAQSDKQVEGFVWRHVSKVYLDGVKPIDLSKVPEDKRELVAEKVKHQQVRASFKAISNKYLLKHDG